MTPIEIAEAATKAMAEPGTLGVILTIKKGSMPKGFPRGELLNENERDGEVYRTYSIDPAKALSWLVKNKLVEMKHKDEKTIVFNEVEE